MRFRHFKPLKLDGYVLSEVVGPFLGGIVFFLFIFLMFQVLRLAEFFIIHGVSLALLGKLTALMAMSFMPTALPVAFLIAILVGFGRLSADSELVAMKAHGFSLFRLAVPVIGLALAVVGVSMALNLSWVPWSQRTFKKTLIKVSNTKIVSSIHEGTFTSGFFDMLIFVDKVDSKTNQLSHVFIYDEREPKNPLTVVSKTGELVPVKTENDLGTAASMNLFDGSIHRNDIANDTYQKIDFGEYKLFLKIDEGADTSVLKPDYFSLHDLLGKIHTTDLTTYEGREWRGELWRRITVALSPLFFVFLGIGFGTVRTRAIRASAVLIAIVTLTLYYGLQIYATLWLQRGGNPNLLMQMPNCAVMIAGIYAFRKASW
jgi:lipopolysaccharide export system permease protein